MSGAGGGYPSDLTDEQWALVEPLLPLPRVGPKGGRREKHSRRRIVDAIFYVVRTGCAWRQLPKDFAPWPTVYWYFTWWHDDGTVVRIHDALRGRVCEADGRNAEPSAGLTDSQSVRTADTVPVHHRHPRPAPGRARGRGQCPGPRWRSPPVAVDPPGLSQGPEDLGRPGLRRPSGRLDRPDPRPGTGNRPQRTWSARISGSVQAVGGRAHTLVAHRQSASRPRLRSQPSPFGDDDPLGDDRHHGPSPDSGWAGISTRSSAVVPRLRLT